VVGCARSLWFCKQGVSEQGVSEQGFRGKRWPDRWFVAELGLFAHQKCSDLCACFGIRENFMADEISIRTDPMKKIDLPEAAARFRCGFFHSCPFAFLAKESLA